MSTPAAVSVLDLEKRATGPLSFPSLKSFQRISISADGKRVFTHDQDEPRIAVIDTAITNFWLDCTSVTVYSSAPLPDGHGMVAYSPSGKTLSVDLRSLEADPANPILAKPSAKSPSLQTAIERC